MKPTLILQDNNTGPEHVVRQIQDLKIPDEDFSGITGYNFWY